MQPPDGQGLFNDCKLKTFFLLPLLKLIWRIDMEAAMFAQTTHSQHR